MDAILQTLYARKKKADVLGREAIRASQQIYDDLCVQIGLLEIQMDGSTSIMVELLQEVVNDAYAEGWPENMDADVVCKKHSPALLRDIDATEAALNTASAQDDVKEFISLLPKYRKLLNEKKDVSRIYGVFVEQLGFDEVRGPHPWE